MKKTSKAKGVLEILLVIGLILIIPLFFVIRTAANQQPVKKTPMPPMPTTIATLVDTAKPAKQPPACSFPLANITAAESTPEEYTFSEPQVVLTANGNIYHLIEWLPDNQQILMTEDLRSNYVNKNDNAPQQSISLYNPETGESKVYAIRTEGGDLPAWSPDLNAVVYPVLHYTKIDKQNRANKFTRQLWVSYGNPDTAQMLADNLTQLSFVMRPGGSEMLYFSDKQISKLDKSLKKLPSTSFDSAQWDYAKSRRSDNPIGYKMAWQPGTSLIFLYSEGAMQGGGYTFILDADTGHVCELNFGGWALGAHWSSDGRYLAIIKVMDYAFPFSKSDLILLDTKTGKLTTLNVTPQEMEGKHYVDDFVWAPDNRHLLAIGSLISFQNTQNDIHGLYLIDSASGQSIPVAPEYQIYVYPVDGSLAWSPDSSKLLIKCPANGVDRICFITVQRAGQ